MDAYPATGRSLIRVWSERLDRAPGATTARADARARAVPSVNAPEVEERAWVTRAQRGDTVAFRRLVERHGDRAFALAHRMLRDRQEAEDVAQEAFVRAWRALPGFRGDARFGTWLHRIVVRLALDRAQVQRRRGQRECSLDALATPPVAPAPRDDALGERAVAALLAQLSEPQRLSVVLFYLHDRSVEQVSAILELPANTVKTHLSRARARLRQVWPLGEGPV